MCGPDCFCPRCLIEDMDAHILATRGEEALDRINGTMVNIPTNAAATAVKTYSMAAGTRVGRGYVRGMSPKQRKFLIHLIATKETTNLRLLTGQTIKLNEIDKMGLPAAKAVIDKLLGCPNKVTQSVRMATDGQRNFMRSLNTQAGNPMTESEILAVTFADVQDTLTKLKAAKSAPAKSNATKAPVTEGGYISGDRVFTVYKAKTGTHLLVKEWSGHSWQYVGSVYKLPADATRMTLEESQAFGRKYVQCCQCGRTLTKKESREAGIGPICAGRF